MWPFKKRDKAPKDTESVEFKRYMARRLDGRAIRYVLEKCETNDKIIGKDGFISVYGEDISVICGEKTLFRCRIDELSACWEFMVWKACISPDAISPKTANAPLWRIINIIATDC